MRNKTIRLSEERMHELLARCTTADKIQHGNQPHDDIVSGDTFSVLPCLKPSSFDLIIADPPYNLTKNYGSSVFSKKSCNSYAEYTRKWLSLCYPLLRDGGSIYVCCDWESGLLTGSILSEFFTLRNRITWQREKGRGAARNWKNGLEDIYFATKGDDYVFNLDAVKIRRRVIAPYRENGKPKDWQDENGKRYRDTCPSNFWDDITIPFWSMPENTDHPTQKPEKLIAKLILASTDTGDSVLDPFSGSGSVCVTAKKLDRHFVGIECEDAYCAVAVERLLRADTDTAIQGFSDGVFTERNYK